eukprot:4648106-Amphidinium_carterae.1
MFWVLGLTLDPASRAFASRSAARAQIYRTSSLEYRTLKLMFCEAHLDSVATLDALWNPGRRAN